jgi:predicted Zn finger-like uncharacterized protein
LARGSRKVNWYKTIFLIEALEVIRILDAKAVVGYLAAAVLLFFGVIFVWASRGVPTRLVTGGILIVTALAIIYFARRQTSVQITQRLEVPGQVKVQALKCPNCSAVLDVTKIKIAEGVPSIKCPYCGNSFEVTEEPKW